MVVRHFTHALAGYTALVKGLKAKGAVVDAGFGPPACGQAGGERFGAGPASARTDPPPRAHAGSSIQLAHPDQTISLASTPPVRSMSFRPFQGSAAGNAGCKNAG